MSAPGFDNDPEAGALSTYAAVVAGLPDGYVLLDRDASVLAANPAARRLLGRGEPLVLPDAVRTLLASGPEFRDEIAVTDDAVLLVSRSPVEPDRSVLVVRERAAHRADGRSQDEFTQALRAQAHETANRLHTVVSLIEMEEYDEAVAFAVAELELSQTLADRLIEGVSDPVLAALLLGKSAQGAQRGIDLVVARGTFLPVVPGRSTELVTILGNLIDNAMHVLGEGDPDAERRVWVAGSFRPAGNGSGPVTIEVSDTGPGVPVPAREHMFAAGWTTKTRVGPAGPRGLGLALVGQAVRRLGGSITVGDRPDGPGALFTVTFELSGGGMMPAAAVNVLVVEDEPIAARAHAAYTNRINGFTTAAVVGSAAACLRRLGEGGIDLVLLDLHLPDSEGLDLYKRIRAAGLPVDVIIVSSARDADLVRGAVAFGAVQYIIKPFTFAAFKDKMLAYADFRVEIGSGSDGGRVDQEAVDRALSSLRAPAARSLPKGMSGDTLDAILGALKQRYPLDDAPPSDVDPDGLSATTVASLIGASRITARRYLEYLADEGVLHRSLRYGAVGRPEALYRPATR